MKQSKIFSFVFRIVCIVLFLALIAPQISNAKRPKGKRNTGFGLGLIVGAPTGISGKYWLNKVNAIDAAIAWSLGSGSDFILHGNYLWHLFNQIKMKEDHLDVYYGIGGRILFIDKDRGKKDDIKFGPRAPAGLRYEFKEVPIEVFTEIAIILNLIQSVDIDLNIGIGGRYFF